MSCSVIDRVIHPFVDELRVDFDLPTAAPKLVESVLTRWLAQYRVIDADLRVLQRLCSGVGLPSDVESSEVTKLHKELQERKKTITKALDAVNVENPEWYRILHDKYVLGTPWRSVARSITRDGKPLTDDQYRGARSKAIRAFRKQLSLCGKGV